MQKKKNNSQESPAAGAIKQKLLPQQDVQALVRNVPELFSFCSKIVHEQYSNVSPGEPEQSKVEVAKKIRMIMNKHENIIHRILCKTIEQKLSWTFGSANKFI